MFVETCERVDYSLDVKIQRRGHNPILLNGTLVKCIHDVGALSFNLDINDKTLSNLQLIDMKKSLSGIVVNRVWHVHTFELLNQAQLCNIYRGDKTKPDLVGVDQWLYYQIMFPQGLYWARFDWIEPVGEE